MKLPGCVNDAIKDESVSSFDYLTEFWLQFYNLRIIGTWLKGFISGKLELLKEIMVCKIVGKIDSPILLKIVVLLSTYIINLVDALIWFPKPFQPVPPLAFELHWQMALIYQQNEFDYLVF